MGAKNLLGEILAGKFGKNWVEMKICGLKMGEILGSWSY